MNFLDLHERLRFETWRRIDQGMLSIPLLARRMHVAPSHVSNFLRGRRHFSLPVLDRLLLALALTAEQICRPGPGESSPAKAPARMAAVPVVGEQDAMRLPLIPPGSAHGSLRLPEAWLARYAAQPTAGRRRWMRFVAVRVTVAQAEPMQPVLRAGTIVVIDRHYNAFIPWNPPHPNLSAVCFGSQLLLRYATAEGGSLLLRPHALESPVQLIECASHESPRDFLVGRVCLCLSEP